MKNSNWKGIPSKESLHFPEKGGRKFGNKIWDQGFRWQTEDLVEFLFPSERMPRFHETAVEYLKFILENGDTLEDGKKEFCMQSGCSWGTLKKSIIPKLYRFGLISRTRALPKNGGWSIKSTRKSYEKESLRFATMLRKMADEWESMINTGRLRRQADIQKEREDEREIEKQERLEWERYLREKGD